MLLVVHPFTVVIGTIGMRVSSISMCFIVAPLSFINISIGVNQLSMPVGLIVAPIAFVFRTIRPELVPVAITLVVEPLACVSCSILQGHRPSLDSACLISILLSCSAFLVLPVSTFAVIQLLLVGILCCLTHLPHYSLAAINRYLCAVVAIALEVLSSEAFLQHRVILIV